MKATACRLLHGARSERIDWGGIERVSPFAAGSAGASSAGGSNKATIYALKTTTELPSCLNGCNETNPQQAADVKPGYCFITDRCYSEGEIAPFVGMGCKVCNHTANPLDFSFLNVIPDHCVIDGECIDAGAHKQCAPAFAMWTTLATHATRQPTPTRTRLLTGACDPTCRCRLCRRP